MPSSSEHDQRDSNDLKNAPRPFSARLLKVLHMHSLNICWFVNTLISKAVSNLHTKSSEKARENVALSCLRSGGLRKMEDSLGRNQLSILQIQELATELQNVNDLPLIKSRKKIFRFLMLSKLGGRGVQSPSYQI